MRLVMIGVLLALARALPATAGEVTTEFIGLDASNVSYVNGALTVQWDEAYEILSANVETGFHDAVASIQPGIPHSYGINTASGTAAVNALGLARRRSDGYEFRFFTRIWDPGCRLTIPPTAANNCVRPSGGCSHVETADCADGTSVSVTCTGTRGCSGSHHDEAVGQPGGGRADCRAENVSQTEENGTTVVATLVIEKFKLCPPAPPPPPPPPPGGQPPTP